VLTNRPYWQQNSSAVFALCRSERCGDTTRSGYSLAPEKMQPQLLLHLPILRTTTSTTAFPCERTHDQTCMLCFGRDTSPVLSTCKHNTNQRRLRDQRWKQMTVMNWRLTAMSGLAFQVATVESWMRSMPEEESFLCRNAFSRTSWFQTLLSGQSGAPFRRVGCHLRLSSRVTMKVGKRVNLAQLLLNKPRPYMYALPLGVDPVS